MIFNNFMSLKIICLFNNLFNYFIIILLLVTLSPKYDTKDFYK